MNRCFAFTMAALIAGLAIGYAGANSARSGSAVQPRIIPVSIEVLRRDLVGRLGFKDEAEYVADPDRPTAGLERLLQKWNTYAPDRVVTLDDWVVGVERQQGGDSPRLGMQSDGRFRVAVTGYRVVGRGSTTWIAMWMREP